MEYPMSWHDYIATDPNVCHGKACIKGTRIMDENLPVEAAELLQWAGYDVATVVAEGLK